MSRRIPELGDQIPRSGNILTRALGLFVFSLAGWRVLGKLPNLKKFIIIAAPHTSNIDGILGVAGLLAMGFKANLMVKKDAFVGPLGWLLKALGAIPVDRESPIGVVEQTAEEFRRRESLVLLIAPEGTRKQARDFKSGFHRIARAAEVPVLPVAINYKEKAAILGEAMNMQADYDDDLSLLLEFFHANGIGRHPQRYSLPMRQNR